MLGEPSSPSLSTPIDGEGRIILVVDDVPDDTRLVALILAKYGFKTIEAESARTALKVIQAHGSKIDLLLTDLVMPAVDGLTLIRKARELHPDLKVLLMTGVQSLKEIEGIRFVLGLGNLLRKPFNHNDLLKAVLLALEKPKVAPILSGT